MRAILVGGLAVGTTRDLGQREPGWLDELPDLLAVLSFAIGTMLVRLVLNWVPLHVRPERHERGA